jgi:hypothetical protein
MASADVAREHESGRSVRPAFKDVGAARLLTDRVQVQALYQFQHVVLIRGIAQPNLQPFGLWLARLRARGVDNSQLTTQNDFAPMISV